MLYPLKFKPLYKDRIWGPESFAPGLAKAVPQGRKIGESWELSGLPGNTSVVSNGILKGSDLQDIIEVYMGDLVGEGVYAKFGNMFPLLLKFIHTADVLSVQVHPNDMQALERHGCYGKTEMWYIIDADPGSYIYLGFRGQTDEDAILTAMGDGTLPGLMNRIEVSAGDSFVIPAGTVHALGKGILLAEIQQASDITYRLYDWDRVDSEGHPRLLHIGMALETMDFSAYEPRLERGKDRCPYFDVRELRVGDSLIRDYGQVDSMVAYMALQGMVEVGTDGGTENLRAGETMMVPAEFDRVELTGSGRLLEITINTITT